jgi:hypothetical protein
MAVVFASAERTQEVATYTSEFARGRDAVGILLSLDITAVANTPTLDIKLQAYNDVTDEWEDLTDSAGNAIAFAQKTGTGEDQLKVCPGVVEKLASTSRQYALVPPHKLRAHATVGNAASDSITFSLGVTRL